MLYLLKINNKSKGENVMKNKKIILAIVIIIISLCMIAIWINKNINNKVQLENNSCSIIQYKAGTRNQIKKINITSSEDMEKLNNFIRKLRPLSLEEMVDLSLLKEIDIQYYNYIKIGIQLGEKDYCYYINEKENISSLAHMPNGLYEWIAEKINEID